MDDLSDGVLLFELMSQISPDLFRADTIIRNTHDNFSARLGNLNKLKRQIEKFYTDILNVPSTKIVDHVEITAIARSAERQNSIMLLELIMGAVVSCKSKETYISRILDLNESIQVELMVFIQKILNKLGETKLTDEEERKEVTQLKHENRNLAYQCEELQGALKEIEQKQRDLMNDNEKYMKRIKALEDELERRIGNRDWNVDESLFKLEEKIEKQDKIIKELEAKLVETEKAHTDELRMTKDELDMAQEKLIQLGKVESTLELYKKRLEDLSTYKKKVKELQEEKNSLEETIKQNETNMSEIITLKQTLNFYKDQISQEKERSAELTLALETKDQQIRELQKFKKDLEGKKREFLIPETVTQREFHSKASLLETEKEEEDFSLQSGMQRELEEQIERLEMENKTLKSQLGGGGGVVQEINKQMDTIYVAKKKLEEKCREEKRLRKDEEAKTAQIEDEKNQIAKSLADCQEKLEAAGEECQALHSKIQMLEAEKLIWEKIQNECESLKKERESHVHDIKQLFKEKDEITKQLIDSKEENHKLDSMIIQKEMSIKACEIDLEKVANRLREAQESERIALNQLEVMKRNQSELNEQSVDKIKYLELERDIMKLKSEISTLKLELREKEDSLNSMQEEKNRTEIELKEALRQKEESLSSSHQEEIRDIKEKLIQRDNEVDFLKRSKEELRNAWEKEMKIMSMIVYGTGMEI
eukprot:CAMPEP_0202949902 /NCGR_PEP_ID=MMETSP1395-20130829/16726_1 /ASSEMBLY_ACC=CAM_ASM_000871 /TAXON_ID=5961 /ORGANISM="Blepharisma japonicum, Strain Stock R1072" /LENGTH=708 /DNA_ID=CAMNT_0049653335 /DNA_START=53 /DNA_END=2176 /DNA_ORIENTATION=-